MTNRRVDLVFFGVILTVVLVAYYTTNRPSDDEGPIPELPDFELPELAFEASFDFPYRVVEFEHRSVPRLMLSRDVESALGEIRMALLNSSKLVEIRSTEQLAAVGE